MLAAIKANLADRTGKTLTQWIKISRSGPEGARKERVAWLKKEYGLGGVTAAIIVDEASGGGPTRQYDDPEALLDAQYEGARSALRPLYDRLANWITGLGEVTVTICKTYVGFRHRRQFAVIKPATDDRLHLGLALPGEPSTARLARSKGLGGGDRITHRVSIGSARDVDRQVRAWLIQAHEAN
jgi:hypothetical protein